MFAGFDWQLIVNSFVNCFEKLKGEMLLFNWQQMVSAFIVLFADEKDDDEEEEENPKEEFSNQDLCNASINNVIFAVNNLTEIANRIIPKNLRII